MLRDPLSRVSFLVGLTQIDTELAEAVRRQGCPRCGGALHRAAYLRKPRGGPVGLPDRCFLRESLCCGRFGCRGRVLPPSCRFLGRRVYWGCVILVLVTLARGRNEGPAATQLRDQLQVSSKTLRRWVGYFRDVFPTSRWWRALRGRVGVEVCQTGLPGSLLQAFFERHRDGETAIIACLRFLASAHCYQIGVA